jgi:uncharacterized cofD-like protein
MTRSRTASGSSLDPATLGSGACRRVVALGGGHGLAASLQALRRVTDSLTAIVGVADDGGSSGRLRSEFGILPPGDLRMALAALCGDDSWGRTWERVIQHRFGGSGDLAGHSVGNLLITALWEQTGDAVTGLDWVAALLEARGRVLPCSDVPLTIVAEVVGHDPADPEAITFVRGQVEVATTPGTVLGIALDPAEPPACREALAAVREADAIVLGPGSWYTSVIPHLVIPELARAIAESPARRIVVLNLNPQVGETTGFASHTYLDVLYNYLPDLRVDTVIADRHHVEDMASLRRSCDDLGAEVFLMDVAKVGGEQAGMHDPQRLAVAFDTVLA